MKTAEHYSTIKEANLNSVGAAGKQTLYTESRLRVKANVERFFESATTK